MKTVEELKREFAVKWAFTYPDIDNNEIVDFDFLSDLNTLISEHYISKEENEEYIDAFYYPKEFVEWMMMRGHIGIVDRRGYLYSSPLLFLDKFKGECTIENLFTYWKENEK